jgi:hypothetical protein
MRTSYGLRPRYSEREETMATYNEPTKADMITLIVNLLDETGIDLYLNVLPEVFINWEEKDVLALLPAEIVEAALVYLRQEKEAQDAE